MGKKRNSNSNKAGNNSGRLSYKDFKKQQSGQQSYADFKKKQQAMQPDPTEQEKQRRQALIEQERQRQDQRTVKMPSMMQKAYVDRYNQDIDAMNSYNSWANQAAKDYNTLAKRSQFMQPKRENDAKVANAYIDWANQVGKDYNTLARRSQFLQKKEQKDIDAANAYIDWANQVGRDYNRLAKKSQMLQKKQQQDIDAANAYIDWGNRMAQDLYRAGRKGGSEGAQQLAADLKNKDFLQTMREKNAYLKAGAEEAAPEQKELPVMAVSPGQALVNSLRNRRKYAAQTRESVLNYEGWRENLGSDYQKGGQNVTAENVKDYLGEVEKDISRGAYDEGGDFRLHSNARQRTEAEQARQEALNYRKWLNENKPQTEEEKRAMQLKAEETNAQRGTWLDVNGLNIGNMSEADNIRTRPEDYWDEDNRDDYDQFIYDAMHGEGSYMARLEALRTDSDVDKLEQEIDQMWDRLEKGEMHLYDQEDTTRQQEHADAAALLSGSDQGRQKYAEKLQKEVDRDELLEKYAENAPAAEAFDESMNPGDTEDWGAYGQSNKVFVPKGDKADMAFYNINNSWEDQQRQKGLVTEDGRIIGERPGWADMQDEWFMLDVPRKEYGGRSERDIFNGYYQAGMKDEAMAFLDALRPVLQERKAMAQEFDMRERARLEVAGVNVGGIAGAGTALLKPFAAAAEGVDVLGSLLGIEGSGDINSQWHALGNAIRSVRDERGNVWDEAVVGWLGEGAAGLGKKYNGALYSILDNAVAMGTGRLATANIVDPEKAMSALTGAVQWIMSTGAAADEFSEKLSSGMGADEAAIYAIGSGVIEAITEKYSVEALFSEDMMDLLGDWKALTSFAMKNFITEGSEEVASDALSMMLDDVLSVVYGHRSDFEDKYQAYLNQNMNSEEAMKRAMGDVWQQFGESFWFGGLSGWFMTGGRAAANVGNQIMEGRQARRVNSITDMSGTDQMIANAEALGEGTQSAELAAKLKDKVARGGKASSVQLGRLAQNIQAESQQKMAEIRKATIQKNAEEALQKQGQADAGELAEIVSKAVTEGTQSLTAVEKDALTSSQAAIDTLKDLNSKSNLSEKVKNDIREAEKDLRRVVQSTENLTRGLTAEGVSAESVKEQMATERDIRNAEGERVEGSREVIFDGQYGKLEGLEKTADGWKFRVNVGGETKLADATDLKATKFTTAAIIRDQGMDPALYSGRYTDTVLKQIDSGNVQNVGEYLSSAYKIRWAAYLGQEMPETHISEQAAKELYQVSMADAMQEWKDGQGERNAKGAGQGRATYGGAEYGTKAFDKKISTLSSEERNRVKAVSEWAKDSGVELNFVDRDETGSWRVHGSENARGITINLDSYDNRQNAENGGPKHHIMVTMGHEMTHWLQRNNAQGYIQLKDFVLKSLQNEGMDLAQRAQEKIESRRRGGMEISMTEAIDEMVADACDQVLGNPETINYLKENNNSLYQKVKSFVKNLISRIKSAAAGMEDSASREARLMMYRYGNELSKLWLGAYDDVLQGRVQEMEAAAVSEADLKKMSMAELDSAYMEAVNSSDKARQQELVDQAARDNGYTLKVYHGTPTGGFTQFKDWSYFTEKKEYADRYNHPGASSSRGYSVESSKPMTYALYMNPGRVFDTREKKVSALYNKARMEYGMGELTDNGLPDWTDGRDIIDYIEENDLPYDTIILNEGADGGYGAPVVSRGVSYVTRANMVKSADPVTYDDNGKVIPLSERFNEQKKDIRYSMVDDEETELRNNLNAANDKLKNFRMQMDDMNNNKEYRSLLNKMRGAETKEERIKAAEELNEWKKNNNFDLEGIKEKQYDAYQEVQRLQKELNDYVEKRELAEEKKKIDASGLTENEWRRKEAIDEFGYTTNFREAGYLLPDGKMLNFCGSKGQHTGQRGNDHRSIGAVYATKQGSDAMVDFMAGGNIRVMAETPGIDINSSTEPTSDQYAAIRAMARRFAGEEYFNVDFTDARGNTVDSIEYDGRVNADRIVNDIKTFYKTGEVPQQSTVSQFHYSMTDDGDHMDVANWMMNLTPSALQTEGERQLLRNYRGLRTSLDLSRQRQSDYKKEIRQIESMETLTTEDRDRLTELRNRLKVQEDKEWRLNEELYEVTSSRGYAGMMYTQTKMLRDNVEGKTMEQVQASVDSMTNAAAQADKKIAEYEKKLQKMADTKAVDTIRKVLNRKGLARTAEAMQDQYATSMGKAELESRLAEIMLKELQGEDITEEVDALVADASSNVQGWGDEEVNDALAAMRGMVIEIGPLQMKELKAKGSSLKELRERTKGSGIKFVTGTTSTLDNSIGDLVKQVPSLEGKLENALDSVDKFADYVHGLLNNRQGAAEDYGIDTDEMALFIRTSAQMMLNDQLGGMSRRELQRTVEREMGTVGQALEAVKGARESTREMQKYARQALGSTASMQGDIAAAIDYYNTMAKMAAEVERQNVRKNVIEQLKSDHVREMVEQQQQFKEMLKKDRKARELYQENETLRKQINTNVRRFKNLLTQETDLKNIQEEAKPLARMVSSMLANHDAAGYRHVLYADPRQLADFQARLKKMDESEGSFDADTDLDWLVVKAADPADNDTTAKDRAIQDLMDIETGLLEYAQAEGQGNITLQDRKNALTKVQNAVSEIASMIKARGEAVINGRKMQVYELAERMQEDMRKSRFKGEKGKGATAFSKAVGYGNLTPEYFIKNLRNKTMTLLQEGVHEAENRSGLEAEKARARIAQIAEDTGYRKWDGQEAHEVKVNGGKTVKMTTEQIMSLYATWQREKNQLRPEETTHLLNGGFVLEKNDANRNQAQRPLRMTRELLDKLGDYLTDEQKKYADAIVKYMSTDMAEIGNEASMRMFGIKKFTEQYYFPIKSWGGVLNKSSMSGINNPNDNRAARQSFTKRLTAGARNAVEIGDFTPTAMKHIVGMIRYNTVAPAVENINKVLNQQLEYGERIRDEESGEMIDDTYRLNMRTAFNEAYGENAENYLRKWMEDLNGGVTADRDDSIKGKLLSVFRKGAVSGSMSVALQQPLSYIRAATMINPLYLTEAIMPQHWGKIHEEMLKYSGVAVIKDMGKFDMGQGRSMIDYITPEGKEGAARKVWNKTTELATILPEKMDALTWGRMWIACKLETAAKNKGMDTGSEEFLKKVAKRFNDVMRKTQVYDSVLVKSQNMRSKNYAVKSMTSFMGEPTVSLNVLADAVMNAKETGMGHVANAAATFILSAAAQAAVKAGMRTGRNPDKKKTWWEQFLTQWAGMFLTEANPLNLVPGFSDAVELLKNGELADDALSVLGKAKGIINTLTGWATGKKEDTYRNIEDSVGQVMQIFTGLPMKNLMRDYRAMTNWFSNGTYADREHSTGVIKYGILDTIFTNDSITGMVNSYLTEMGAGYGTKIDDYANRIYIAERRNDEKAVKELKDYYLLALSKADDPEKALQTKLNSLAKKDKSLSAEEKIEALGENGYGSMSQYIADQYKTGQIDRATAEKMYREQFPDKDEKKVAEKFDALEWAREGKPLQAGAKEYTNYTPLMTAIENNRAGEITDAVKRMTELGYTAKDIKQKINGDVKKLYLATTDADERRRLRDAMQKTYKVLGFTAEDADKTIEKWKKDK